MLACTPHPSPLNFLPIKKIHKVLVDHEVSKTSFHRPPITPLQNLGEKVIQKVDILRENVPKFITSILEVVRDLINMLKKEEKCKN